MTTEMLLVIIFIAIIVCVGVLFATFFFLDLLDERKRKPRISRRDTEFIRSGFYQATGDILREAAKHQAKSGIMII